MISRRMYFVLLAILIAAVVCTDYLVEPNVVKYLTMFVLMFCVFMIIKKIFAVNSPADTPAGAIVMACGIFINGAMNNIPFFHKDLSRVFAITLLLLWIFIISSYIKSKVNGTFNALHLQNPVKSFAIGTWIAATSVLGVTIHQRLPEIDLLPESLLFVNSAVYLIYFAKCIKNYKTIFTRNLFKNVHGILLLPTVSIQSIVILGNTVFVGLFPATASRILLAAGACFYVLAFCLIIKRYFFSRSWKIEDDWQNTNCILHGAMSITGLASIYSGAVGENLILVIWIWVLVWFAVVEAIELYRACKRIKAYGVDKGILVYHVTHWSRIFTFGMLYTFTMRFDLSLANVSGSYLNAIHENILRYGTWVMVFLLLTEAYLYFKDKITALKSLETVNK